jgi:hypothetical protein
MKNAVFRDIKRLALVRTDNSEERITFNFRVKRSSYQGTILPLTRDLLRLLLTAKVVPSSPDIDTLMMEMIFSCETSILKRATGRHIQKDGIIRC